MSNTCTFIAVVQLNDLHPQRSLTPYWSEERCFVVFQRLLISSPTRTNRWLMRQPTLVHTSPKRTSLITINLCNHYQLMIHEQPRFNSEEMNILHELDGWSQVANWQSLGETLGWSHQALPLNQPTLRLFEKSYWTNLFNSRNTIDKVTYQSLIPMSGSCWSSTPINH